MQDYFNYFTEIEERFCQRRRTVVLLSTLDWALIETWKDAGIPLEAVLRGIDAAFDRYDARPSKTRKVNSLAYCAQEVLTAAEDMQEAALGTDRDRKRDSDSGLDATSVATYLERNANQLEALAGPNRTAAALGRNSSSPPLPATVLPLVHDSVSTLRDLATGMKGSQFARLEDLERRLTVIEEKLFAALLAATPDEQLVEVRADADRELAPYRRNMSASQIDQLQKQYLQKRLLDRYGLPRLSLFYM